MKLNELINLYLMSNHFKALALTTQKSYRSKLKRMLSCADFLAQDVGCEWFLSVSQDLSASEANQTQIILNAVFKWGNSNHNLTIKPISCRKKAHKAIPTTAMQPSNLAELMAYADKEGMTSKGVVANAMVCMYLTGLRDTELINAKQEDIKRTVDGSWVLEVTYGKGREKGASSRAVGLNDLSLARLRWFDSKSLYIVPMGVREYKAFHIVWLRVRTDLPTCRSLTPHSPRRGFATRLMKEGYGIYTIMKLLGHRDVKTTERYLELDQHQIAQQFKGFSI
jgi:site-specific recombinase XerD